VHCCNQYMGFVAMTTYRRAYWQSEHMRGIGRHTGELEMSVCLVFTLNASCSCRHSVMKNICVAVVRPRPPPPPPVFQWQFPRSTWANAFHSSCTCSRRECLGMIGRGCPSCHQLCENINHSYLISSCCHALSCC